MQIYRALIGPRSIDEDRARKEFILTILLLGAIGLSLAAFVIVSVGALILKSAYTGAPPVAVLIPLLIFLALYGLSRVRFGRVSAYIFIMIFFMLATYPIFVWGIQLPQSLLMYALVVIMAGILIGTRFAVAMTVLSFGALATMVHLQLAGIHRPDLSWSGHPGDYTDAVVFGITLGVIALVSWLYNREMQKSLNRAHASEAALKWERDLLEVKVEERTDELKQAQLEKTQQLYRFAEFGRLSADLMHDLTNPLTAVSLNLEQLKTKERSIILNRAIRGIKHVESYVEAARKQLQKQSELKSFSVGVEIGHALKVVDPRARKLRVVIHQKIAKQNLRLFGNPIKFNQLIVNLAINAVDAYEGSARQAERAIWISAERHRDKVMISVKDLGHGIAKQDIKRIFEPFFTTKSAEKGTGIGLSISKNIVENDFRGRIVVRSSAKAGTEFVVSLPLTKQ